MMGRIHPDSDVSRLITTPIFKNWIRERQSPMVVGSFRGCSRKGSSSSKGSQQDSSKSGNWRSNRHFLKTNSVVSVIHWAGRIGIDTRVSSVRARKRSQIVYPSRLGSIRVMIKNFRSGAAQERIHFVKLSFRERSRRSRHWKSPETSSKYDPSETPPVGRQAVSSQGSGRGAAAKFPASRLQARRAIRAGRIRQRGGGPWAAGQIREGPATRPPRPQHDAAQGRIAGPR